MKNELISLTRLYALTDRHILLRAECPTHIVILYVLGLREEQLDTPETSTGF